MIPALVVYAAGVGLGLLRSDASWPTRVGLSLMWPLGPLAFAITVAVLLLTSLVAFPVFGAVVLAAAIAGYLLL